MVIVLRQPTPGSGASAGPWIIWYRVWLLLFSAFDALEKKKKTLQTAIPFLTSCSTDLPLKLLEPSLSQQTGTGWCGRPSSSRLDCCPPSCRNARWTILQQNGFRLPYRYCSILVWYKNRVCLQLKKFKVSVLA